MTLPLNTRPILDMLNPLNWPKVAEHIAKECPGLVIFKYWNPYFALCFGYLANKLRKSGSKICFIVDNVYPHEYFPFSKVLAHYCLSNGNLFITHSKKVTDELIELVPTAFVKEIPHPAYDYGQKINIAQARRKLILPQITNWGTRPIILFFGYIRPYKGLDILLHAFALLQGWKEDAMLLVAGEPFEDMAKYKALADALGIYDKVIWHDRYIPDEQVKLYFSAADLLVLPYKGTTQSGIAEIARSFDLPVIATNTGGLSEQVKVTVPPNNAEALCQAMVRFFTDSLDCGYKQQATTFDDLAELITESVE
jgi:glycosyltransferase involved in cell wall biosynthesis